MSKMNDLLQIIYKVYFENNTKSKKYYIKIKKHSIKHKPINKQHINNINKCFNFKKQLQYKDSQIKIISQVPFSIYVIDNLANIWKSVLSKN